MLVPESLRIPMAMVGVWTPQGQVLCLRCDPRARPQQWATDPEGVANARCDRCGVPVYLTSDNVARLQQLRDELRLRGIYDFSLWQTGGMCVALGTMIGAVEYMITVESECQGYVMHETRRVVSWGGPHPAEVTWPGLGIPPGVPHAMIPTGRLEWFVGAMDEDQRDVIPSLTFTTRTVGDAAQRIARHYRRTIEQLGPGPVVQENPPRDFAAETYVSPRERELTSRETRVREIAIGLKSGEPWAIEAAVEAMAPAVPAGATLIPVPGHRAGPPGLGASLLAHALAARTGARVRDVLVRTMQVPSSRERRRRGLRGLTPKMHAASMRARSVPDGPLVLVDNVVVSGATFEGARRALGRDALGVAYARGGPWRLPSMNPPRGDMAKLRRAVGQRRECYPAAEVLYHAKGGRRAGLTPMQQRHQGRSHWWVRGAQGEVLDPAAAQFTRPVPYERGRGRGFLTKDPSRRAQELARRAGVKLRRT